MERLSVAASWSICASSPDSVALILSCPKLPRSRAEHVTARCNRLSVLYFPFSETPLLEMKI